MSATRKIVAAADVGPSPETLSEKHTIVASFHDFEGLPHKNREYALSPAMPCHGHLWKIKVYPGWYVYDTTEPSTSVYLVHEGGGKVKASVAIQIGSLTRTGTKIFESISKSWGQCKFLSRSDVLDPTNGFLDDNGSLVIHVDIQIWTDTPTAWTPRKRLRRDMLESLESANEGDVYFVVANKRFVVFRALIARRAPILGEIAAEERSRTDIPINDVDSTIFGTLLHFVYTDEAPQNMDSRAVLEVADRFGCSSLKVVAEAEIIKAGIDAQNAAELLLFADAHSCALLRESALDFCITHPSAIKDSEGWEQLKESPGLLAELLGASPSRFSDSDYDTMRVATLRQKLDEKDLDVDGTRETLIQRLKDHATTEN